MSVSEPALAAPGVSESSCFDTPHRVPPASQPVSPEQPRPSRSRERGWHLRFWRNRRAQVSAVVLLLLAALALAALVVAPQSPTEQRLVQRLKPPLSVEDGGRAHLAGTDQFGRDVLSRLIYGVRTPLVVGFSSALLGALIGLLVGLAAGYFGGWVDTVLSTLMDIQLSLPYILLGLTVIALFGPSVAGLVLVFTLTSWASNARVARSTALSLRRIQFVEAARALGAGHVWILRRHVIANVLPATLVVGSYQVAQFIIYEAAFSFFGLGVPPPEPTWGSMVADGRNYLREAWWLGLFPGLCIVLIALSVNLFGDGLRDALDPRELD